MSVKTSVDLDKKTLEECQKLSEYPRLAEIISVPAEREKDINNAQIISVTGKEVVIRVAGQPVNAKVAFSCLVQPKSNDKVLCAKDEEGTHYVLSIIERPDRQTMTLSFPEDVIMKTDQGSLNMMSGKSVNIVSCEQLNFIAKEELHQSEKATIHIDEITTQGNHFSGYFKKVSLVGEIMHSFVERFTRKAKSYIRQTEIDDQVQAGQIIRKADGLISMKSESTVLKSEKNTIIDGEHVFTAL